MMFGLSILLSLAAAWIGLNFGGCSWAYWTGSAWLSRILADSAGVAEFYRKHYSPLGGVASVFQRERNDWQPVPAQMYALVISHEIGRLKRQGRVALASVTVLLILFCVVSLYTSYWVAASFGSAFVVSVLFRERLRERPSARAYATQVLIDLFRPVRLWMEADRQTLNAQAARMGIEAIVRTIDEYDPVDQAELFTTRPELSLGPTELSIERPAEMAMAMGMAGYNFNSRSDMAIGYDAQHFDMVLRIRRDRNKPRAVRDAA